VAAVVDVSVSGGHWHLLVAEVTSSLLSLYLDSKLLMSRYHQ